MWSWLITHSVPLTSTSLSLRSLSLFLSLSALFLSLVFLSISLSQDTGTVLLPTDIKYYQMFGGEKVVFEKEEVDEMKKFGKPGNL